MVKQRSRAVNVPSPGPSFEQLLQLHEQTDKIRIACDSEFEGVHTLSIQYAARLGDEIVVQVYRSPGVPDMPKGVTLDQPEVLNKCSRVLIRPVKVITPDLSPAQVLIDLFQLQGFRPVSRFDGEGMPLVPDISSIPVQLIAHFWEADFMRIFGRNHFTKLLRAREEMKVELYIQAHKLLAFREQNQYGSPVLDYLGTDDGLIPLRVGTFDTMLPFGKASLDSLAATFVGIRKVETITKEDKGRMESVFRDRPREAYKYAVMDAVLTLLVEEGMRKAHKVLYQALGFTDEEIPKMRSTLGSRVASLISRLIAKKATGSVLLSKTGKPRKDGTIGPVAQRKVETLLQTGSGESIAAEQLSKFKQQIGDTHGGLLYSRSPDKIFHEGTGQFADIDLSGCYGTIIKGISLYIGQPVVLEPGSRGMTLAKAMAFLREHAAGDDAGFVKVSGAIRSFPNTLIPSTRDALTNRNYQKRAAKKRARARRQGFPFDWLYEVRKQTRGTRIYTDVIAAGVATRATWLMIQALPEKWRREYERLEVDSIVFYPRKLVANIGPQYDRLVERTALEETAWSSKLDMEGLRRVTVEHLDSAYVALRFPFNDLAEKLRAMRAKAKKEHGPKSPEELAVKQTLNTIYGATASKYLPTNNVVCANVITAKARALAFGMQTSLNGYQVITDGCIYRRDQIPAGTFGDCLKAAADYPIRRVEEGIHFIDPAKVPLDDAEFTDWYRRHVKRFFGVKGAEYDQLFSLHSLEHKLSGDPEQPTFDALCCDGSAQYLKLLKDGDGWQVADFKARGYKQEAKDKLQPWMLDTYTKDCYHGPPPITESSTLIKYKDAGKIGVRSLKDLQEDDKDTRTPDDLPAKIFVPLGLVQKKVQVYKILKRSTYLFRSPEQEEKVVKAMTKFAKANGCGIEVLAMRRGHSGRRQDSVEDIARIIYRYIRMGGDNLSKELNLTRDFEDPNNVRAKHLRKLEWLRQVVDLQLTRQIDVRNAEPEERLTGLLVDSSNVIPVR